MSEQKELEAIQEVPKRTSAKKWTESARKVRGLVRDMYVRAFTEGKPVAWVMVTLANELFVAMDVLPIYPENYAGLCATKRVGDPFIDRAEADGFSNVTCSYARIGLGYAALWKDMGEIPSFAPEGGMAKPIMMVGSSLVCDTRYKWFQTYSRYLDVPYYAFDMLDPPAATAYRPDVREQYIKYNLAQLQGLVSFMEECLGRKMDWDKLDEIVRRGEKTYALWYDAYMLAGRAVPCPFPAEDSFNCFVPAYFMMGEVEALDFYQGLYDEIKYKVDNKIGSIPEEKYRLLWGGGLPPWHTMQIFNYVEEQGAVFVFQSTYLPLRFADIPDRISDPLERMAHARYEATISRAEHDRKVGIFGLCDFVPPGSPLLFVDELKVDGVVMHWLRSCRGTTIGQIYQKNLLEEHTSIPTLFLESDMCDVRDYFEADWKMKLNAFLETLETRQKARS
ncbi:MAG: 2-hydroxyacyl-CoA dehydratase subunit D [Dehalococcoidia bacterium]